MRWLSSTAILALAFGAGCNTQEAIEERVMVRCDGPEGPEHYDLQEIARRGPEKLGMRQVKTCDEARDFMKRYYDFLESTPGEEPPAAPAIEPAHGAELTAPPPGAPIGKLSLGIKNAEASNVEQAGVVEVGGVCTGVLISERAILTAAHCVDDYMGGSKNAWLALSVDRYLPAEDQVYLGTVRANIHPSYAGDGDAAYDLAVIKLIPPDVFPVFTSSDRTRIYTGLGSTIDTMRLYGRGANHDNGSGSSVLRWMYFTPDWWGSQHFLQDADSSRTCEGDSGGPTIDWTPGGWRVVAGIHSGSVKLLGDACAMWGGKQRSTRLQNKIAFIEDMLDVTCNPFEDSGWSYVRCW